MSKSLEEIIEINYQSAIRRKQITGYTRLIDMLDKLQEEVDELREVCVNNKGLDRKELADVALVTFSIARHLNVPLLEEMEKKAEFNTIRKD